MDRESQALFGHIVKLFTEEAPIVRHITYVRRGAPRTNKNTIRKGAAATSSTRTKIDGISLCDSTATLSYGRENEVRAISEMRNSSMPATKPLSAIQKGEAVCRTPLPFGAELSNAPFM